MKAVIGLVQLGCVIVGVFAVINGQWLLMVGAWIAAGLVGLVGNRMVRSIDGISETGREAMGKVGHAIELLRTGEFRAASGVTRSAVADFKLGGDRSFLPIALTLHAVALAAVRDVPGAQKALDEASDLLQSVPAELASQVADMLQVHALLQRELDQGVPDPSGLVSDFLAFNDAP